jgi:predicted alpha/beta hydrolase family esterase
LRANWQDHEQSLNKVNSMLQSDPDNPELLEWKETLTKMLEWLRENSLKRMIRDARLGVKNKSSQN